MQLKQSSIKDRDVPVQDDVLSLYDHMLPDGPWRTCMRFLAVEEKGEADEKAESSQGSEPPHTSRRLHRMSVAIEMNKEMMPSSTTRGHG